ncbi:MAG: beta-lactamase family protein, partial [Candidatus Saccharimonas sp.]|nr:beta-lactamase family protein [Planctomycetaceae bacterium]
MNRTDFASDFPRTHAVIAHGIERGLHTGCQVYVSLRGEVLADAGVGESRPGVGMTADTINLWLSAGKPLTAVAVMQQCERGTLSLDDRVARFISEFAAGGKSEITIRHLLTHTGGLRNVETGYPDVSWDEVIRRISVSPLEVNWIVGHTAGYHTTTSWFILGELLQRVTGRPYSDMMRDELLRPLGLNDTWAALPFDQFAAYGERIGWLYAREQGELKLLDWHNAARC